MGHSLQHRGFSQNVVLSKFKSSMKSLIEAMDKAGVNILKEKFIPTLIHVQIPTIRTDGDTAIIRTFLKQLRLVNNTYFVRFATALDWVVTSDSSDIFYTRPNESSKHADCIWSLQIMDSNTVGIAVQIPFSCRKSHARKNMSQAMADDWGVPFTGVEPDTIARDVFRFYDAAKLAKAYETLDEDTHIMFVPNYDGWGFYPIILTGMTIADIERKWKSYITYVDSLQMRHRDSMMIDKPSPIVSITHLVTMIQTNDLGPDLRHLHAHTNYHLAELLFGAYLFMDDTTPKQVSGHELVVFDQLVTDDDQFSTYSAIAIVPLDPNDR